MENLNLSKGACDVLASDHKGEEHVNKTISLWKETYSLLKHKMCGIKFVVYTVYTIVYTGYSY